MNNPPAVSQLIVDAVGDVSRIHTRPIDLAAYASDASHYLLTPAAAGVADSSREVVDILRAASRSETPVTIRSGGTSLSGQSSGAGIIIDTRQRSRGIEVLDAGRRVRVQPGATVAQRA